MVNINGVYRSKETPWVNVHGVYRKGYPFYNVNGIWRRTGDPNFKLDINQIEHLEIWYGVDPLLLKENLNFNPNLNDKITIGITNTSIDPNPKGIIFQYNTWRHEEWGCFALAGSIYVKTKDFQLINLGEISLNNNMVQNVNMEIKYILTQENKGRQYKGWNQFFSGDNHISIEENPYGFENIVTMFPIENRAPNFVGHCYLGIVNSPRVDVNMDGSEGNITQEFYSIKINGDEYPFIIKGLNYNGRSIID